MKPTTPIIHGLRNRYAARCSRAATLPRVLLLAKLVLLIACPVSTEGTALRFHSAVAGGGPAGLLLLGAALSGFLHCPSMFCARLLFEGNPLIGVAPARASHVCLPGLVELGLVSGLGLLQGLAGRRAVQHAGEHAVHGQRDVPDIRNVDLRLSEL